MNGVENLNDINLFIKIDQSIVVDKSKVCLEDVAKIYCSNKDIEENVKKIVLYEFEKGDDTKKIVSIMKPIELIQQKYKNIQIENLGEQDFIIYYKKNKESKPKVINIIFMCLLAFFGAGYSVMAYNTDVNAVDLFSKLHELFMGKSPEDPSIIQLAYSIGLAIGVIIFFNHGGNKWVSDDPTPLQVQTRLYEQDVNTSVVINSERKKESLDVD